MTAPASLPSSFAALLLTPLDYLAAAYLLARGRALAPVKPPTVACDGCDAPMGVECATWCQFNGTDVDDPPTPDLPPVVACCYCGKPQTDVSHYARIEDHDEEPAPLCRACSENAEPSVTDIRQKVRADREQRKMSQTKDGGSPSGFTCCYCGQPQTSVDHWSFIDQSEPVAVCDVCWNDYAFTLPMIRQKVRAGRAREAEHASVRERAQHGRSLETDVLCDDPACGCRR